MQSKVQRRGLGVGSVPSRKANLFEKDLSRGFQDILYIGVKTGYLAFMAKRCPKRFVLGFTESGKFYFYSKTLQQLMSSGYVYLVPCVLSSVRACAYIFGVDFGVACSE